MCHLIVNFNDVPYCVLCRYYMDTYFCIVIFNTYSFG